MTSNPAVTERNIQKPNAYLLYSRPEQNSLVTYHTVQSLQVRMCLACRHFHFNSVDWLSDNLHVVSSWYLRTMGKEFIFRFSRRSWGRNAWRTPKNFCVGGYPEDGFLGGEMRYRISRSIAKSEVRISKSKSGFPNRTQPWSKKIIGCAWSFILLEVIKKVYWSWNIS